MSTGYGYKPYVKKLVYETYDAGKYYFPENPRKTWDDVTMMWTEGALGVALAYIRAGNKEKGKEIIDEVLKFRSSSNGIYYSSFYATIALLLDKNIEVKSHAGVKQKLGEEFVVTEKAAYL